VAVEEEAVVAEPRLAAVGAAEVAGAAELALLRAVAEAAWAEAAWAEAAEWPALE
jgi:hypothetical protein